MRFIVDDVKTMGFEVPEKKFPWVALILALPAVAMMVKK